MKRIRSSSSLALKILLRDGSRGVIITHANSTRWSCSEVGGAGDC